MKGSLVTVELEAPALANNPLGDPARRSLRVYLPPGYESSEESYPSAYFLHPFMSSGASWTNHSVLARSVPERIDDLIEARGLPPLIAVFPDGATSLGGTQWNNSPAIGRYQDFIVQNVVPQVDASWRTRRVASQRMVLGRSSGGYGALLLGRDHPELFAHCASNAGDACFEYCYQPDFPKAAAAFLKAGGYAPWYREMHDRARHTKLRGEDHSALNILAMAASYSPKAGAPLGLELPFDPETARIREDVFERWLSVDPVRYARSHGAALGLLQTVFLECGVKDEFNLRWGTRMVAETLRKQRVEVLHEEYDDGHGGTNYRFDRALVVLTSRLPKG